MAEYRAWAHEWSKYLKEQLDVLGFWVDTGIPARITGSAPMDLPNGSANVTWIIRWDDMAARESGWEALRAEPGWPAMWKAHPGFDGYLHMSVRFLEEA